MQRFYWVIEGVLAGCSRPGEMSRETLEDDLAWLRLQGIGALVSLTERPLAAEALAQQGMEWVHLPVEDLTAPTQEQLLHALEFIDEQTRHGRGVAVHCLMGQGRAGTVLAAYLIRQGSSDEEAVQTMRRLCPGAIGSPSQEQALHTFAERRDWIL